MTYAHKRVAAQVSRLGREAGVRVTTDSGENAFGNTVHDDTFDRTVIALRTYPNRNTERESNIGTRSQDRPVFIVPVGEQFNDPPGENDYLVYDGEKYEVKATTKYDTHVEFFGEPVLHEDDGDV